MAILDVRVIPDPVLRVITNPVHVFDTNLHAFLDDMYETMVSSNGIGLAAPQVGDTRRIAIMDLSIDGIPQPVITSLGNHDPQTHLHKGRLEMINASVVQTGTAVSSDEGCLSIPDFRDSIKRHSSITITSFDRHGNKFQCDAEELAAFCIQHEMDHLDGILFVDHLSRLKKQLFRRWCAKNNFQFQERT